MQTYNGKTLYLKATAYTKSMDWTFNYDDACWFETYSDAEDYAKKYFKNFNKWTIKSVYYDI